MKKTLMLCAMVLSIGLVGGCSKSDKDDCGDYVKKICDKLESCGYLDDIGYSKSDCTGELNASVKAENTSTQECKDTWEDEFDMPCDQLF